MFITVISSFTMIFQPVAVTFVCISQLILHSYSYPYSLDNVLTAEASDRDDALSAHSKALLDKNILYFSTTVHSFILIGHESSLSVSRCGQQRQGRMFIHKQT